MSPRHNYRNIHLVVLRLSLAEGCAKPSLPIGDDPIQYRYIPLFCMSRLKVCERRNPHYR